MTERTRHGFTPEQIEFLQELIARKATPGFDRPKLMCLIGGLVAAGLAVAGLLWAEIGSVREELGFEIGSVRAELREEIRENRSAIAELAKGQARIEAILDERLPRNR